ncbi:hemolysin-type calcium-binding protein [Pseudorhodobacter sp. E13]|uniref:Hint domain-containing protein n=1 Tax=Pseudorhodobacter sp. E13 TaxID=2487931 RepID=UPI000F8E1F89|nr:Hint domain-containing protein [Pseudorhodobacter sp. E13]RUS59820.1 hemolysin-type calcium-binding protein [Pseudorhodobacter sp. E13]
MGTGFKGTFVISWSQTETDGLKAAPLDVLAVGASWRWTGETVRVDGAQDVLLLEGALGAADIRKKAARTVRRLIGAALPVGGDPAAGVADHDLDAPEQGFIVTNGTHSYTVTLIEVPDTGARLLMFVDEIPPRDVDLWVVRLAIDRTAQAAGARAAGGVICFTPGTAIRTADGAKRIEDLRPGDWISTKDNGQQEILWTGHRRMTGARLHAMPHLRPIRFRAGALGLGRPDDDLLVSPQHRMLVNGPAAQALFNTSEVLVAAEDLINDVSITVDHTQREVTYIHILLERHQVIWANGLETESFHPSNTALDTVAPEQRASLLHLLPGLEVNPHVYGDYARRNLSGSEAAILMHSLAA